MLVGPWEISHCDNGKEFKGVFKALCKKWRIKLINGHSRHPQSQGMVENGNKTFKRRLNAWLSDNKTKKWVEGIPYVVMALNSTKCDTTKKTPYELVFKQRFRRWDLERTAEDEERLQNELEDEESDMEMEYAMEHENAEGKNRFFPL